MRSSFSNLITLVQMQLKDKIDFSFLKSGKTVLFKVVYKVLMFALITFAVKILFDYIIGFHLFSPVDEMDFRAYLILMTILFVLSFISCLFRVTDTLYFAKDNAFLVTMPAKTQVLFSSKLIVCLIYEFIKNINYILPFFIAYGLTMGLTVLYFIRVILAIVWFTILSVSISGMLSIPTMFILIFIKKSRILEYITALAIITLGTLLLIKIISIIPEDINLIRDWGKIYWVVQDALEYFASKAIPFSLLLEMFTGMRYGSNIFKLFLLKNVITFAVTVGIVGLSFVVIFLASKPLFLHMMSSPFEYKKNEHIVPSKNVKRGKFISAVIENIIQTFRSPNLLYGGLIVAILTPIAIFLQNKIVAAMDTAIFGNYLAVTFNILIVMLMTISSNINIASTYSREGASAYINKVNPVDYRITLSAKFIFPAFINMISILVSAIIINSFSNLGTFSTIMLTIAMWSAYVAHLFWSAEMDVMNPQNLQYQTTGSEQKNPNEVKSAICGFIISIVFAFITFFLMRENMRVVFIKVAFISIVLLIIRTYLFFIRIKLYYKEKQ